MIKAQRNVLSGINLNTVVIMSLATIAVVVVSFMAEGFFSVRNLTNLLYQISALGLLVIGITPVIIIGELDMSLVALMTVSAIVGTLIIGLSGSITLGIFAALAIGALIGAFTGFFVGKMKVVSFVVTLAIMIVGGGVAAHLTKSVSISDLPEPYYWIGQGRIGIIPVPFFIFSFFALAGHLLISRHYVGRWVYSIGTNARASKMAGIPVERVVLYVFIFAGLMAAVSGIVQSSKLGYASASMIRTGTLVNYIAAATIGGVSIRGGKGSILNAAFGTIIIVVISNACTFLGVGYYENLIIKGCIIVFIVGIDQIDFAKVISKIRGGKTKLE